MSTNKDNTKQDVEDSTLKLTSSTNAKLDEEKKVQTDKANEQLILQSVAAANATKKVSVNENPAVKVDEEAEELKAKGKQGPDPSKDLGSKKEEEKPINSKDKDKDELSWKWLGGEWSKGAVSLGVAGFNLAKGVVKIGVGIVGEPIGFFVEKLGQGAGSKTVENAGKWLRNELGSGLVKQGGYEMAKEFRSWFTNKPWPGSYEEYKKLNEDKSKEEVKNPAVKDQNEEKDIKNIKDTKKTDEIKENKTNIEQKNENKVENQNIAVGATASSAIAAAQVTATTTAVQPNANSSLPTPNQVNQPLVDSMKNVNQASEQAKKEELGDIQDTKKFDAIKNQENRKNNLVTNAIDATVTSSISPSTPVGKTDSSEVKPLAEDLTKVTSKPKPR